MSAFRSMGCILNGIHKKENQNELNKLFEKYQVDVNYIQEKLKW